MRTFTVIAIPMPESDYCYYVHPSDDAQKGCFIDVQDSSLVEQFRDDFGIHVPVAMTMATHREAERSGACLGLKRSFPRMVLMGPADDPVVGCTHPIKNGREFTLHRGQIQVKCFSAPGVSGQMLYYF